MGNLSRSMTLVALFGAMLVLSPGCDEGDDNFFVTDSGSGGSSGVETPESELGPNEQPPGVMFEIMEITGGTGASGTFQSGDVISVTFSITQTSGEAWNLEDLDDARILVSGPTFNYQRVIAEINDVRDRAVVVEPGVYRYTFEGPIPDVYLPPLNDTDAFDASDGELQGQALLDGTYTVGLYGYFRYTAGGDSFRDHGDAVAHFPLGPTAGMVEREVVTLDHCNQCHTKLQLHGGFRQSLTICLMCHTSGAEDRNSPDVANGTPGASIDFKVMIHKIHHGAHLPSVLGVTTLPNGSRDYTADPEPYRLVGFGDSIHDYSGIEWPQYPHLVAPHLKDAGYAAQLPEEQGLEDELRGGAFDCTKCHGDPDGDGPVEAPSQGSIAYSQPSQQACGSCHDDVVWEFPYAANFQQHPPQPDNGNCTICHTQQGTQISVVDAHIHPLEDRTRNPGIALELVSAVEGGDDDGDGTLDPGEKLAVTFFVRDESGNQIDPATVGSLSTTVWGPTNNANLLLNTGISTSILTGPQPFTVNLPQPISLDYLGDSALGSGDEFTTSRAPLRPEGTTVISVRDSAGTTVSTTTVVATRPFDNFLDVASTVGFSVGDILVLDDDTPEEEYVKVQLVDGNRLWLDPGQTFATNFSHDVGATVEEVSLSNLTEGVDYSRDPLTGTITELQDFGDGVEVLASYLSDFVVPALYPRPINSSPDVGDESGKWTAKDLVSGTYSVFLWGQRQINIAAFGESNSYRAPSTSTSVDFLVGSATRVEPYDLISSEQNCLSCHGDLYFHGSNRRGFQACIGCHGVVGSEDRPRYIQGNALDTTGTTIDFRSMLHKIHMGSDLTNPESYIVVGFGGSQNTFEEVVFPSMPRRAQDCVACHGDDNAAWMEPRNRSHPTQQDAPLRKWDVCLTCHDSDDAIGHAASQTAPGGEQACGVCHGVGDLLSPENVHQLRDD